MIDEREELCHIIKNILTSFTRWGLQRGDGFDDITIYDVDRFAEEWINDNVDEMPNISMDKESGESLMGIINTKLADPDTNLRQE